MHSCRRKLSVCYLFIFLHSKLTQSMVHWVYLEVGRYNASVYFLLNFCVTMTDDRCSRTKCLRGIVSVKCSRCLVQRCADPRILSPHPFVDSDLRSTTVSATICNLGSAAHSHPQCWQWVKHGVIDRAHARSVSSEFVLLTVRMRMVDYRQECWWACKCARPNKRQVLFPVRAQGGMIANLSMTGFLISL